MANFTKAQQTSQQVLKENYISKPPVPVLELTKNYGYEVLETASLPHEISGFVDIQEKIIYLNALDSETRKAFTIAHELGHILLHQPELKQNPDVGILYRQPLGKKNDDPLEQEANFFAATLLVPPPMLKDVLREYGDILEDNINVLSDLFGVSKEVMGYRLDDLVKENQDGKD